MIFIQKFITTFIATIVVFFLMNRLFGDYVVFGMISLPYLQALLTASFGVALAASCVRPILHDDLNWNLSDQGWIFLYLAVNMGVIFIMTRTPLSNSIGMGVRGFWMSILLGLIVTGVQYFILKDALHPKKLKR